MTPILIPTPTSASTLPSVPTLEVTPAIQAPAASSVVPPITVVAQPRRRSTAANSSVASSAQPSMATVSIAALVLSFSLQ